MKRHFLIGIGLAVATAGSLHAQEPVVSVNGDVLTQQQFDQALDQRTQGRSGQLPDAQKRQFLQQLVDLQLLAQMAEGRGIADDPAVQAELANTRRAVLARGLIEQVSEEKVSEEAVKDAYKKQYVEQSGGEEFKARHILVEEEKKAKDLIAQLDKGADFAELAKEHSTGPTGKRGGDLGWFSPDQMVPAFTKATRKLEPGSYSEEPVKTQFGWHVIRLDDTRTAEPPKLKAVRDKLEQRIAQRKIQQMVQERRESAEIDYQADWANE